jgi:hypothetical protein
MYQDSSEILSTLTQSLFRERNREYFVDTI